MKTIFKFSLVFFALLLSVAGMAQTTQYNSENGTAIKGYDPVAYFMQSKATQGNDKFTTEWSGAKWKFSSQANLDSFKMAPEKYAPQYGGHCAYGCSENHKAPTDPNAWTIVNNKLYLNYNLKVKDMWMKEAEKRIASANANWAALNKE